MKNLLLIIFTSFIINSCSTSKINPERRCPRISANFYKRIIQDKFIIIKNFDTIKYNEVKFECLSSSFYTKQVMYDNFGKWDLVRYKEKNRHPILIWNKVQLFKNDTTQFTIAATGDENHKTIYSSFMAFNNNKDLLAKDSEFKEKLINYFSKLLKRREKNKEFYRVYWNLVDKRKLKNL